MVCICSCLNFSKKELHCSQNQLILRSSQSQSKRLWILGLGLLMLLWEEQQRVSTSHAFISRASSPPPPNEHLPFRQQPSTTLAGDARHQPPRCYHDTFAFFIYHEPSDSVAFRFRRCPPPSSVLSCRLRHDHVRLATISARIMQTLHEQGSAAQNFRMLRFN